MYLKTIEKEVAYQYEHYNDNFDHEQYDDEAEEYEDDD